MKKKWLRVTALFLAAVLALTPLVSASQALGTEIHKSQTHLAEGVDYTCQYLWSATYSDLRTERYLAYSPNDLVQPMVAYGSSVLSRETLSSLAKGLESRGKRVLGGVNGDYFVLATGEPLGIVVTDGVLRSSSSYLYALGFDDDGNAFIGKPDLSITAAFRGYTLKVGALNKTRTDTDGYDLYTSDFGAETGNTQPGIDVILSPTVDEEGGWDGLVVGGSVSCTVEQVLTSTGSIPIPEGKLILSISHNNSQWLADELAALEPGDAVEIAVSADDSRWESAVTAIGGLYKLVTDGVAESGLDAAQAPRTAVGVRADGTAVFYTVDGRQSGYSVGASLGQVAKRLVELGCVEAIALDGGGSTSFGATLPGEGAFGLLNKPSDGAQRTVSNALFLVADQAPVGQAESLILTPGDAMLLSGAQVALSGLSVDAIGQTVASYNGSQLRFAATGAGTFEDGVFTAGTQAGTFTVSASAGGLTGSAVLTVVSTPDRITVRDQASGAALSSLQLESGETLELSASASYCNLPLISTDESFTWAVTGGLGTIDQSGRLTAGETSGTGAVTVTAGGRTVSIPLTVSGHIDTVENFEGAFSAPDGGDVLLQPEQDPAYVRYGRQSARLRYDAAGGSVSAGLALELREGERYLSLWVYGDGSGSSLSARLGLADGGSETLFLTALNFTGWRQITVSLPAGASQVTALELSGGAGCIWLDQVTSSNQPATDTTPPTVTVSLSGGTVSAVPADDRDKAFSPEQISVCYDGRELPFTLNGGTLTASLPASDGAAHRVTVTVTDASGNMGRASADISAAGEGERPFGDTEGHWAEDYVNYLHSQGIANGVAVGDGFHFQPDKDITRGEFTLMVARWLGLDLSAYSGVELPFADQVHIPDWCLDSVKALYALGILRGSAQDGQTYAFADRSLTRAEAMTMLGRLLPRGYAQTELSFADAADIPAWAADYVAVLTALGVVSGYEDGTIAPGDAIRRGEMAKILYTLR
ncbi:MAG: phosphodiester glycosidase family protein [Oscillospiraceae bacterium]